MHYLDDFPYDFLRGPVIDKNNRAQQKPAQNGEREGISRAEMEAPIGTAKKGIPDSPLLMCYGIV
jgi:hypothetical protein